MKNAKSGVAVIIVLGLLALLMVLGVAFTVTMRGERAGAANYLSSASTRHLVWAGLARAIDDINTTMGNDFYPPGDYLVSGGAGWNTNANSGVALLTQQVRPDVPDAVTAFLDADHGVIRSRWVDVGVGRVAYLVVNLSDMLDLNHVGGEARAGGRSVAELMLATNILTVTEYAGLITARDAAGGSFDSLPAFRNLAPSVPPDLFKTYSRYLADTNRTGVVYIGENVDDLIVNRAEIEAALQNLGQAPETINAAQATRIFDQLLDYVDDSGDLAPSNLSGPNTKPVPMVNEVAMRINIGIGGSGLGVLGQPQIETWAPFVLPSSVFFTLEGRYNVVVEERADGTPINQYEAGGDFSSNPTGFVISPSRFNAPSINFVAGPFAGVVATNTFGVTMVLSNLVVRSGAEIVDQVTGAFVFQGDWAPGDPPADIAWEPTTYQVTDPRFNWEVPATINAASPWQTRRPPPDGSAFLSASINTTNEWTSFFLGLRDAGQAHIQKGALLHVSGRGQLDSPLELGHLLLLPSATLSSPQNYWRHIRVFNHAPNVRRHRILENFTTNTNFVNATSEPVRGLVNINTVDPRILRTAFAGMPHPYVGGAAVDSAYPERMAAVVAVIQGHLSDNGPFGSVTGLLGVDFRSHADLADLSDLELEALLAYTVELLGVRNNLFLVVASAAPAGDAQAQLSMVRGRNSAMAIVWRDPVANEEGLHDNFVRYFRWLD